MMDWFSCLRKSKRENLKLHNPTTSMYSSTWRKLHSFPDYERASTEDKLAFTEFAIRAIGLELQNHHAAVVLYEKQNPNAIFDLFPVPRVFPESVPEEDVPLKGKIVITIPYDLGRLFSSVLHIKKEGFHRPPAETTGYFFPEINLVFVVNGRHHAVAALLMNGECADVSVHSEVYMLAEAFPRLEVSSDKQFWLFGDSKLPILDARFAMLYELAKEAADLKTTCSLK